MNNEAFNDRNVNDSYFMVDIEDYPTDGWGKFKRVCKEKLLEANFLLVFG